jgi:16S rRNA (adenine1518-N6/adenine1519-N6)-dimethyltransferase
MRRKTLRNALRTLGDADRVSKAAVDAGLDLGRRGETLSVEEFGRLAACWDALA